MQKYLFPLAVATAILFTSCEKNNENEPVVVPEITVQDRLDVPSEGGEFSVAYSIVNQDESVQVEASSASTWVHSFDCSEAGQVSFVVDPYDNMEEPREATVEIVYGEASASFVVAQGVKSPDFVIEVTDIDYTKFTVSVTPLDKEMYYPALFTDKSVFEKYPTDEELIAHVVEDWTADAANLGVDMNTYLDTKLMKGDMSGMTVSDLYPGEDYVVFVFGITYDLETLTPVYSMEVTSKVVDLLDLDYEITPDVHGADVLVNVVPPDENPYYLTVIEKDDFDGTVDYWQHYLVDYILLNRLVYGLTPEEVLGPNMHSGEIDTLFKLAPNTDFVAMAMSVNYDGVVFSEPSTAEFTTGDVNLSDNIITIEGWLEGDSFFFNINTTNDDPYVWTVKGGSDYEGMTDEEILDVLSSDYFLTMFNTRTGDMEGEMGVEPGSSYVVYAFGCQNGAPTTGLSKFAISVPE